jgi:hypothetical protein
MPPITPANPQVSPWDVFVFEGQTTECVASVVILHSNQIHGSSHPYCCCRSKCFIWSRSVGQDADHLRRDRQELTQADSHSNPRGAGSSIPSFVIKGSGPERFHQCPESISFLVSNSELAAIVHAVTDCLEDTLPRLCSDAKVIGIAIDGSTDRPGLRHTGMSARWCDTQTATTGDLS